MKLNQSISVIAMIVIVNSCSDNTKTNAGIVNTTWHSQELGYSWKAGSANMIILLFSKDSVTFDLPGGDFMGVSELIGGSHLDKKLHYTWDYSADDKQIILLTGDAGSDVTLEISGDSLIWKGGLPVNRDFISLKKVN